ncbi:hypothetical protein FE783_10020 [Paenibacillus mesophilus]|uniref:glycosyl hydrolase family 28-related protein n=1 Tax=Paenibacillus mesophilus TaxID=2582849 RepID=UPI00110DEE48|nr:glycosyl hydrolase family 28-related protein [Paenibacillus mesophilus]TMV49906.1 hypothetical protein FE783_10020 [Paenibacillus mesophilus]
MAGDNNSKNEVECEMVGEGDKNQAGLPGSAESKAGKSISRRALVASMGMAGVALATGGLFQSRVSALDQGITVNDSTYNSAKSANGNAIGIRTMAEQVIDERVPSMIQAEVPAIIQAQVPSLVTTLIDESSVLKITVAELRSMNSTPIGSVYCVTDPDKEGVFIYDPADTASPDNMGTVIVSTAGARFKRVLENRITSVRWFGAVGNGTTDDTVAIQNALDAISSGDILYFPPGTYSITKVFVNTAGITLDGTGTIKATYGIYLKEGDFEARNLNFVASAYSTQARAISMGPAEVQGRSRDVKGIKIHNCSFSGFFYSVDMRGGEYEYSGPPQYYLHNVEIIGCTSVAPVGSNAGHFQNTQTYNTTIMNCKTYNGQNATSYNFIQSNGWLKVIGNYDDNNSYGSCEVENNSSRAVIAGNTFRKKVWIDDSSNVTISGNVIEESIYLTVQSLDLESILVTGNITNRIRIEQFGTTQNLSAKGRHIKISENIINGTSGNYGIFITGLGNDRFEDIELSGNMITGTYSSGKIGIVRSSGLKVLARDNIVNGTFVISGSGGTVNGVGNVGASYSGTRNRLTASYNDMEYDGIVLLSPSGSKYKVKVSDGGMLSTEPV